MLELALLFLKKYWLPILLGVAALSLMGYIKVLHLEIDHYKEKAQEYEAVIAANNEKTTELEVAAAAQTQKYKEALHNQFALQQAAGEVAAQRIKNDAESKAIVVSPNVVGLFNGLKPAAQVPTTTITGDAGTASTTEKTLNDLLAVSNENDNNHLKCIKQVEAWQGFWKDWSMKYTSIVNAVAP